MSARSIFCWLAFVLLSLEAPTCLALEWETHSGYRAAKASIAAGGRDGFDMMDGPKAGIEFTNLLSDERSITNQIFLNGSGVAAGDVDGDGLCDLYLCGLDSDNALYRNLGSWRFENISSAAGVACSGQASTGAAFADVDGDSDLDLLVNGVARGTRLFLNDGKGRFQEATEGAGLRHSNGSVSFAIADVNGDGALDVYVVNYRSETMRDMPDMRFRFGVTNGVQQLLAVNDKPANSPENLGRFSFDQASGVLENGEADVLFLNNGKGAFMAQSWTNGSFLDEDGKPVQVPYHWGLSAMLRDLNGDGAPDLYICNDFQSPDGIWLNDGQGRFRAIAREAIRQTSLFSMGMDAADIDRDGFDDLFVADMLSRGHARRQTQVMDAMAFAQFRNTAGDRPQFPRNTLFRNRGNGTYAEIAQFAGVDASDWSWCPAFLDVDLDGYEDLLITTGHWRDAQNIDVAREIENIKKRRPLSTREELRLRLGFPRLDTPNAAFRNRGDLTFEDAGARWNFDSRRISHGMALADLDSDGDLDVIINCLNHAPLLHRNESARPRIAVRLRGAAPNTQGIGARLRVLAPGLPAQTQEIICGGRYLSSDDAMRVFAAGGETNAIKIEVSWRSGARSVIENVPANQVIEINEANALSAPLAASDPAPPSAPFFQDVSASLGYAHVDEPFDDFALQPLLPRKLSNPGPGVAWFDFNGDGWDDIIIGAGRGGRLMAYRNDGNGGFIPQKAKILEPAMESDLTTVLGWKPNATNIVLLLGRSSYESVSTNHPMARHLSLVSGQAEELLSSAASAGPMALADIDRDGDLDLFVGGRAQGGRYPESVASAVLRNERGALRPDAIASEPFASAGLVSGAVFTDFNDDGFPELALACEWGPLRVFRNSAGRHEDWDAPIRWEASAGSVKDLRSLRALTGWWNSITAGDFDNDGRLDLAAGNWGRNHPHRAWPGEPVRMFYASADTSSGFGLIEANYDPGLRKLVPARDLGTLSAVFPELSARFPTFAAFGEAAMRDVAAAGLPPLRETSAAIFDSLILLNRGDHFEARLLPTSTQLAPVFGIGAGDLDGDGNTDLFLAQNFFGVSAAESRLDAGCGVWLRGDGRGGFADVSPKDSGIVALGEGRGVALSDYDHDGRMDVLVGQNRGPAKLFRNARARPGLRVRLEGNEENPGAAGSSARLRFSGGKLGPAHEFRLGGGYWSQDSAEAVLGTPEPPEALEIRWPDGSRTSAKIPAGARSLTRRWRGGH